jgi:flagellar basal body rod protein FlgG
MITGFYAGSSAISYNQQRLAAISNNMANATTTGYRRSLAVLKTREENPLTDQIDPAVARRIPKRYGMDRDGVFTDHSRSGQMTATGNSMHVALGPELKNAFFQVGSNDPADKRTYYTRNGTLSFGPMDASNPASPSILMMSGKAALDADGQSIQIDPTLGELSIGSGGGIQQNGEEVGRIPVFRLNNSSDPTVQKSANLNVLEKQGDSLYAIPDQYADEFHPHKLEIGQAGISSLINQGVLEGSNVNIVSEMMQMMSASKSVAANTTAMRTQMDGLSKLFQMVRR